MPDPTPTTSTAPELGPPPKLPPPLGGGRYVLTRVLGAGGMATVYLATDTMLQVQRAVKLLAPTYVGHSRVRKRFLDEARTMARLRHANIVTVFDVGMEGERPFIVMELIEGGSLMDYIHLHGPADPALAVEVMLGMLGGLGVAHDNGVVHRDIKPHNVLLAEGGVPKLTDFGIARIEDRDDSLTKTGAMMGTLAYMAPEQRRNARGVGAEADIYAAGATLYVMLTGRDPFDLYSSDLHEEVFEGVQPDLAEVIKKACRYRAEHRYPTVIELQHALRAAAVTLEDRPDPDLPTWGPMFRAAPTHDGQTRAAVEARHGATAVPAPSTHTFDIDAFEAKAEALANRIGDTSPGTLEGAAPPLAPPVDRTEAEHEEPLARQGSGTAVLVDEGGEQEGLEAAGERSSLPRWLPWAAGLLVVAGGGLWWSNRTPDAALEGDLAVPEEALEPIAASAPAEEPAERAGALPQPAEDDAVAELGPEEPDPAGEVAPSQPDAASVEPEPPEAPPSPRPAPRTPPREAKPAPSRAQPAKEPAPAPAPAPAVDVPPTVEEAATTGRGFINARPFSNLMLDGVDRGLTGWNGELSPGRHPFTLTTTDGRQHQGSITIVAGQDTRFCWDFEKETDCR
jgi:tRNA A-37 threonylcarbamoyl transferase component Bud32